MAGFGAKSGAKKTKLKPLKPKQQWDRYGDMAKKSTNFEVGVRVIERDDGDQEWLNIGYVNSKDDSNVELAVSRQRAIIVEHAKRLLPLMVRQFVSLIGLKFVTSSNDIIMNSFNPHFLSR